MPADARRNVPENSRPSRVIRLHYPGNGNPNGLDLGQSVRISRCFYPSRSRSLPACQIMRYSSVGIPRALVKGLRAYDTCARPWTTIPGNRCNWRLFPLGRAVAHCASQLLPKESPYFSEMSTETDCLDSLVDAHARRAIGWTIRCELKAIILNISVRSSPGCDIRFPDELWRAKLSLRLMSESDANLGTIYNLRACFRSWGNI